MKKRHDFGALFENIIIYELVRRAQREGKIVGPHHVKMFDSGALSKWLEKYHSKEMVSISDIGSKIEQMVKEIPLVGGITKQ